MIGRVGGPRVVSVFVLWQERGDVSYLKEDPFLCDPWSGSDIKEQTHRRRQLLLSTTWLILCGKEN